MKKIKLNYTRQGYSYIKCTKEDCLNWGGMSICDDCSKTMIEEVYLIFVLGRALCKECFKEWENDARRYEEDIDFQRQTHITWYKSYGFEVQKED